MDKSTSKYYFCSKSAMMPALTKKVSAGNKHKIIADNIIFLLSFD